MSRGRGRPAHQTLDDAREIAGRRGEIIFLPGGRSDAFDIIICEEFRTVFVRVRRTDLELMYAIEVLDKFRYDISRAHRLPLTRVTAREFWLRKKDGTWQFWLIRTDGLYEIREDGMYFERAALPLEVKDEAGGDENGGE